MATRRIPKTKERLTWANIVAYFITNPVDSHNHSKARHKLGMKDDFERPECFGWEGYVYFLPSPTNSEMNHE